MGAAKPGSGCGRLSVVTGGSSSRGIPAWAAAGQRERQEQEDRADAGRRERGRQAEAIRQQAEEQRRKAGEDRKLLESMPPQVRAGVEAARRAEGERAASVLAAGVADGP